VHAREDEQRSEARFPRRRDAERLRFARERLEAAPQISENLVGHPGAHAAGVNEFTVIGIVAEQERAEIGPRSFRVGPADDDELLSVERFGFAPKAAVSGA
jgi:hypothetical protein